MAKIIIKFDETHTLNILNLNSILNEDFTNYVLARLIIKANNNKNIEFLKNNFRINSKLINESFFDDHKDFIIDITKSINIENSNINVKYTYLSVNFDYIYTLSLDNYNFKNTNNKEYTPFFINAIVELYIDKNTKKTYDIELYFDSTTINYYKFFDKNALIINSKLESFMLLRTNPKLTGNIKLVVDENYNLYLDTFSVSKTSILNKKEYKHVSISSNGNYAYDIYKAFKNLPKGELYSIYDDSYDPHKIYKDLNLQIENIYEYGAEYNTDYLYKENMKILAPLYIGKHLPTFFTIFKTTRLQTADYNENTADCFKEMLKNAEVVKIYDLRNSTTIGKYLNNYASQITKYLAGSCYLLFIELDNEKNSENYRQGKNTWKGISIDKGILTEKTETSYFATLILNNKNPQENYNMFILNGFSRNNLIFPNIINLEFMFNDINANDFEMYNYFGLYLTENDFITFNQITKKYNNDNIDITYYNENNEEINLKNTCIDIVDNIEYSDRIFFATTLNNAVYVNKKEDIIDFAKLHVINVPYNNIVLTNANKINFSLYKSFLTMHFNKNISYGEHFKFIINISKTKKIIYEIIASNDNRLAVNNNINNYILENSFCDSDNITYYRINFYTLDENMHEEYANLELQIQRFVNCINAFNDDNFIISTYSENDICIISNYEDIELLHILLQPTADIDEKYKEDYIGYYNKNYKINAYKLDNDILYNKAIYKLYINLGLEILLKTIYSSIVKFIKTSYFKNILVYELNLDVYNNLKDINYPLISTINGYYPNIKFKYEYVEIEEIQENEKVADYIINYVNNIFNSIISPFNSNYSLLLSYYDIKYLNNMINICLPNKLNISLMGINNIKDIDMYINDNKTINYLTNYTVSFYNGEKIILNNTDLRLLKFITYKIISGQINGMTSGKNILFTIVDNTIIYTNDNIIQTMNIIDNTIIFTENTVIQMANINLLDVYNYTINKPILNKENYYIDPNNIEKSNLNIPFVPLINCLWEANGLYFDNISLLDTNLLLNKYDNTIGNFIQNVYTPAGIDDNNYIINNLSQKVKYNENIISLKDFILNSNYKGAIKKYLTKNFVLNSAIAYYNSFIQTLEFIFYGIKFSIKLSNALYANDIKLNEYNNYEIFIINDFDNSLQNEMFISKLEEFILIINHTYNSNNNFYTDNIKYINENNILDTKYKWFNAPYNYEIANTTKINQSLILNKTLLKKLDYDSYIIELDIDKYDIDYVSIHEKPHYSYFKTDEYFVSTNFIDYLKELTYKNNLYYSILLENKNYNLIEQLSGNIITLFNRIYNSLNNILPNNILPNYMFNMDINNFYKVDNLIYNNYKLENNEDILLYNSHNDFTKKYTYIIKNLKENIELQNKIKLYIESFNNNLNMYIINNEETYKLIEINEKYLPVTFVLTTPNLIKFNYGLFNPHFEDIFEFNINDNISEKINLDTLLANTSIKNIKDIKNYIYNKIANTTASYTNNYFIENNHNILSTDWDSNIYRLYENDAVYKDLLGYSIGYTDKMLFGSKCINIHNNYINIDNWNNNISFKYAIAKHNKHEKAKHCLVIQLNITKAFYDNIKNNEILYNNWKSISNSKDIETYINNYIANTLINYYDFSNIELLLYTLLKINNKNAKAIQTQKPVNFELYYINSNCLSNLLTLGNEKIMQIEIDNYEGYIFYPIIKINKI